MQFTVALLALTASTALAAPALNTRSDSTTTVTLCNDRDFTGYCRTFTTALNECVNLADDLNDQVSSVQPEGDSLCYFHVDPNCSLDADYFHIKYPGQGNLSVQPVNGPPGSTRNFEDKISSYRCS